MGGSSVEENLNTFTRYLNVKHHHKIRKTALKCLIQLLEFYPNYMVMEYNPFGGVHLKTGEMKKSPFVIKEEEGMVKENETIKKESDDFKLFEVDEKPSIKNNEDTKLWLNGGVRNIDYVKEEESDLKIRENETGDEKVMMFGLPCSFPVKNPSSLSIKQFNSLIRYSVAPPLFPLLYYIKNLFHSDPFCTIRLNVFRYLFQVLRLLNNEAIQYILQNVKCSNEKDMKDIQDKMLNDLNARDPVDAPPVITPAVINPTVINSSLITSTPGVLKTFNMIVIYLFIYLFF
jgi:hypothetical protein